MRTTAAALVFACIVVLPPIAARADTPVRRTVERSAPAAARVRVADSVGDIHVVGDDGSTVRVTARIRASSDAAAERVGVDVTRSGDENAVTVNVPQSSPSFVHWLFDRSRVSVDLDVRVPRRSAVAVRLSTGDVDVRGIGAAIDAHTSTGDVHLHDVATDANAVTSTGDIAVDLTPGWNGARLTARTSTGDVRIHASPGLHARVEARTSVGDVRNAIGSANVASPVIEARTSVGDVTITTR
jgi:hypothetical protein